MSAQEFQTAALAWVGTLAIVVPAIVAGIVKVLPGIEALATQIEELKQRLDRQGERQNQQERTVAQALAKAEGGSGQAAGASAEQRN